MKINQKEDGSGEIVFDDKEIEVILKHKKIVLSKYFLKHFINLFIRLFFEYQRKFEPELKAVTTFPDQEIETKSPEDNL